MKISTHTPLAGRDVIVRPHPRSIMKISTHTPLAGRDAANTTVGGVFAHFNSHAPRGA